MRVASYLDREARGLPIVILVQRNAQGFGKLDEVLPTTLKQASVGRKGHGLFHYEVSRMVWSKLAALTTFPRRTVSVRSDSTPSLPIRCRQRVSEEGAIGASC